MTRTRFFIDTDKSDEEILAAIEKVSVSKHLPGRHNQKTHGRRGASVLINKLAVDLNARAEVLEPGITKAVSAVAAPDDFRKLEFKVKSVESIADKIRIDAAKSYNLNHELAAANIHDLNRYMLVWEGEESCWAKYQAVNARLEDDGWSIWDDKDKNGFQSGDWYAGMNVHYEKAGEFVEIQFHTPDTFAAKLVSDPLYNNVREASDQEVVKLADEIYDIYNPKNPLKVPPGHEDFGTPTRFTVGKQLASQFMKRVEYWVWSVDEKLNPLALFEVTGNGLVSQWDVATASFVPSRVTLPALSGLGGSPNYTRVSDAFARKEMKEHSGDKKQSFSVPVKVVKSDEVKNLVFGWASVAFTPDGKQIIDKQGHAIDIEDLEDTAYAFTVNGHGSGDMHSSEGFGELVESMVLTKEKAELMGIPPGTTPEGWWVGFRVPPEYHEQVRSGERTMFSIEGTAKLEPFDS